MSLIKSTATVGGLTMVSRLLGFVREILMARYLGAGMAADAFFVAFKLPNFFRRLFAEGAFSAAFVPMFSAAYEGGHKEGRRFAIQVLSALLPILIVFTAFFELMMPWLVYAITGGFHDNDPVKFQLTVDLTRITFPFLMLISLVSLLGGVLNGLGKFAAAAAAPILLNIALILALGLFHDNQAISARALAWAVTLSGLAQVVWLAWVNQKAGMALKIRWPQLTPEVKEMLRVMWPAALGAGAMQVNLLVDTVLATRYLPQGSISYLYYGDRLNQLPIGVIGVAVGTVLLPGLSRRLAGGDKAGAIHSQNRAVELAMFLTLPAMVGLLCLAEILIQVLLEHGAFTHEAALASAAALTAYAAGLPAYVLIKILTPGFYARKDTKTPVRIAMLSVLANSALGVALMFPLAHVGLALATALSAWLNAGLLYLTLRRRGHFHIDGRLMGRGLRMMLAGALMAPGLFYGAQALDAWFRAGGARAVAALGLLIGFGVAVYLLAAFLSGAVRWRELRAQLRRSA